MSEHKEDPFASSVLFTYILNIIFQDGGIQTRAVVPQPDTLVPSTALPHASQQFSYKLCGPIFKYLFFVKSHGA